jgi:hypothetical protein
MIVHLKDEVVATRVFSYIQGWLDEKDKQANRIKGYFLNNKFGVNDLCQLTHNEFWVLFHQACNDDMQGKF